MKRVHTWKGPALGVLGVVFGLLISSFVHADDTSPISRLLNAKISLNSKLR